MSEVAVTYPLPGDGVRRLEEHHQVRVHRGEERLSGEALARFAGGAEALVTLVNDGVDAAVFAACTSLAVVANVGVGVDNIDLAAAARAGVTVTNTPDVLTEATADLTWALILAVTRRVVEGDAVMRAGAFDGWRLDYMLGIGLQGKTLGIVGLGRIGRAVARRAAAFGMRVVAFDPQPPTEGSGEVALYRALDEVLPLADVLSVHTPLTPATRGLLDRRRLELLPPGAVVINTARGGIVDEAALAALLAEGRLGGVGLDVHADEPRAHPALRQRRDVVLLPHLGSATVETRVAMADLAVANVLAVLAGREAITPVAPAAGSG